MRMGKRDLQRIEVLTEVLAGRRTPESAAAVLDMTMRQVQPLLNRVPAEPNIETPCANPSLHRPMLLQAQKLNKILCHREQRYVGAQLTFHYEREQIILEQTQLSQRGLAGNTWSCTSRDRPLAIRMERSGSCLPGLLQGPAGKPVNHTAILENKRLGHALALVKSAAGSQAGDDDQQLEDRVAKPDLVPRLSPASRQSGRITIRLAHAKVIIVRTG